MSHTNVLASSTLLLTNQTKTNGTWHLLHLPRLSQFGTLAMPTSVVLKSMLTRHRVLSTKCCMPTRKNRHRMQQPILWSISPSLFLTDTVLLLPPTSPATLLRQCRSLLHLPLPPTDTALNEFLSSPMTQFLFNLDMSTQFRSIMKRFLLYRITINMLLTNRNTRLLKRNTRQINDNNKHKTYPLMQLRNYCNG